jgi:hypothetical protein
MDKLLAFHAYFIHILIYFVTLDTHISCLIYKDLLISSETESAYSPLIIHKLLMIIFTIRNNSRVGKCKGKAKGKCHLRTGHEVPGWEYWCSSTFFLTSALCGMGGQRHAPAALPPGKTRYPLCWRLVGSQ